MALTPPETIDPSIAIAACRAGELGVLDLEYSREAGEARTAIKKLVRYARHPFGIKLDGNREELLHRLATDFPDQLQVAILTPPGSLDALKQWVQVFHQRDISVYIEATSLEQARLGAPAGVDGVIAKGNEAPGWVDQETTFILLQRLLREISLPVWARGGIGLHTAAACFAAGAAGVVLDSQLLLTRESPLPDQARSLISRMDGSETICIGEEIHAPFRIYFRQALPVIEDLGRMEKTLLESSSPAAEIQRTWKDEIHRRAGWNRPEHDLWVLGQDAAFARPLADRFKTVGGILQGMKQAVDDQLRLARAAKPLAEASPLASSHGTRFPIVQGPMTRVSDQASFALKVAESGALPFLALALLRAKEAKALLEETRDVLGDLPWGVGILGFVPLDLRQEQLEVIRAVRPSFALIAGGRPDQARTLEKEGIPTYLHVPSPGLLKMFLQEGARRFVFEGRECGGHVGPRSSFVLWDSMIDVLLESLTGEEMAECHVLFAGGVHDARSSSMVASMASPLADLGAKVGVLMGTAYLFTEEAVTTGAILKGFQQEAIRCTGTVLLESGPGHVVRSAPTPYVDLFQEEKRLRSAEGKPAEDLKIELEELNIGRLRLASKGVKHHPRRGEDPAAPRWITVGEEEQRAEGLYMIGQVAALRDRTCTMAELHGEVSLEGTDRLMRLETPDLSPSPGKRRPSPSDVAIVGMGCLLPKAPDVDAYWQNIMNKVDAITEVPRERWDWRLYFDADQRTRDKVYARWGGFLDPIHFDPMSYGMVPNSLKSIEPVQLLALEVVRAALQDAGYEGRPFPRERTSVIIGATGGVADLGQNYIFRSSLPSYLNREEIAKIADRLPEWTEDSFAGILLNVIAGRISNRFNLGGVNYMVDAACASSLAGVYLAARELEQGSSDMVIVGGTDTFQSPFTYLCFSKTMALSPRGKCRTFDRNADGTCISEGLSVLVLKRLADAERDGDRIYAVIKGVAGSSDGRAKGLTAPHPVGQARALERAYAQADVPPSTIGLVEAHGTGTVAGDRSEIESLKRVFESAGTPEKSIALGSVKSMIGHTKGAAGVTGLIKLALALHHKVLPATLGVEAPNPSLGGCPLYANTETRPWIRGAGEHPRRAAISSFGFGGTNFHAVVEEYQGDFQEAGHTPVVRRWPSELLLWSGDSREEIRSQICSLQEALEGGAKPELQNLAHALWRRAGERPGMKLAVVADSLEDLSRKLDAAGERLAGDECTEIKDPRGVYFTEKPLAREGKVAFLFSGQGAQYPDMLRDLSIHFAEVRGRFERADRVLAGRYPKGLSAYVFPPPRFSEEEEQACRKDLARTDITQPAVGAAGLGLYRLLEVLGLRPDMAGGHSYGEYVALCAAGVFDEETLYRISEARGRFILEEAGSDSGTMAAVDAGPDRIKEILSSLEEVWIANLNSPRQTIIAGTQAGIARAVERLQATKLTTRPVAVSCAFHSPIVAPACSRLKEFLSRVDFAEPAYPVYSNTTAGPYPGDPGKISAILGDHLLKPVEFQQEVEAMYRAGARIFIEVGPNRILANLSQQILGERPSLVLPADIRDRCGLLQLHHLLGQLAVHGIPLELDRLYRGRITCEHRLERLVEETREKPLPENLWLIDGGSSRPLKGQGGTGTTTKALVQEEGDGMVRKSEQTAGKDESRKHPRAEDAAPSHRTGMKPEVSRRIPDAQERDARAGPPGPVPMAAPPSMNDAVPSSAGVTYSPSADDDLKDILIQHQKLMQNFLETQQRIMLAYLQGADAGVPPLPAEGTLEALDASSGGLPPLELDDEVPGVTGGSAGARLEASDGESPIQEESEEVSSPVETVDDRQPPATVEAAGADRIQEELLRIVSERTGYPPDMLDLDLDLEADLGIDSIKRVEVVGALGQQYPELSRNEEVREELTRLKTLRGIIDRMADASKSILGSPKAGSAPGVDPSPPSAGPDSPVKEPEGGLDPERIKEDLLEIVSDRTGYPPDMLDLELDLEADLGIDSIKRVEIVGALGQRYPDLSADEQAREELTRLKTLKAMIERISRAPQPPVRERLEEPVEQELEQEETPPVPEAGTGSENGDDLPRFLLKTVDAPPAEPPLQIPADSVFLVTDDGRGIAPALAAGIGRLGGRAEIVGLADEIGHAGEGALKADLTDPESVENLVERIRRKLGPLAGIIHLLPCGERSSVGNGNLEDWKAQIKKDVKSLYYLARAAGKDLREAAAQGGGWLIAATASEGTFAGEDPEGNAFSTGQGGIAGLVNTIAVEWPEVHCKVVDLDYSGAGGDALAAHLLREMALRDGERLVGYRGSRRMVLRPERAPLPEETSNPLCLDSDWVVMITGGARGITAEAALALARKYRPTLLLVGRTPLPEGDESPETAGIASPADLKKALMDQLRQSGDEVRLPEVEAAYHRLCRQREMRTNIAAMEEAGAGVRYFQLDVRDETAFADFIDRVYEEYGRLDGVIHGAGIIQDKLIEDKRPDSFDLVFDTKADSAYILCAKLRPESLRFLIFFSSIACMGNRGQCDYAATNAVINKLAVHLDRQWPGRVASILWGPWAKTGMATEEVQRQFAERGVQLIAPEDGCRWLDQEIRHGRKGHVEIIFGKGPWEQGNGDGSSRDSAALPLLDGVRFGRAPDGTVEVVRVLDPSRDRYLMDHVLDGKPVFPAAMAMEIFAEVAQRAWPEKKVVAVRDLQVLKGIILEEGGRAVRVTARPAKAPAAGESSLEVCMEILTPEGPGRPHYRAAVLLADEAPAPPDVGPESGSKLSPLPMTVEEAYSRWLFHGACFQGIETVEGMNDQEILGRLKTVPPDLCLAAGPAGPWLIDPVVVDSSLQLVILWERAHHDMTPLPVRIDGFRIYRSLSTAPVRCRLRLETRNEGQLLKADIYYFDSTDRLLGILEGLECSCSRALNRLTGQSYAERR